MITQPPVWKIYGLCLLIIAVLTVSSTPLIGRARERFDEKICRKSLMQITAAKIYYALDNNLSDGTSVTMENLVQHGKVITSPPLFPRSATQIQVNPIGMQATCVLDGKTLHPITKQADQLTTAAASRP